MEASELRRRADAGRLCASTKTANQQKSVIRNSEWYLDYGPQSAVAACCLGTKVNPGVVPGFAQLFIWAIEMTLH